MIATIDSVYFRMASKSIDQIDHVINDVMRKQLLELQDHLIKINNEISEYTQLQQSIEFLKEHKPNGFKTKVDIGSNIFMKAKVENIEPILIDIGLHTYLELNIEEALKFLTMKIKILTKEATIVREQTIKIRADIKVLLIYLSEMQMVPHK